MAKHTIFMTGDIFKEALRVAFLKLSPRKLCKNPVIFIVEISALLATWLLIRNMTGHAVVPTFIIVQITLWLWFTVLFANFAESVAEGRGKAQAGSLRKTKTDTYAKRLSTLDEHGRQDKVISSRLDAGDLVLVEAGDTIPSDGDVVKGIAMVDESAITGESAAVIRESGGDRSAVTGGTRVVSDWIIIEITASPGESFLDRMISMVEGAKRQKTPNEIALTILLVGMTIIFLIVTVTLESFAMFSGKTIPIIYLISLLVTLIPTTISGLLSAIGIAGMDRLVKFNIIAKSGRAAEAAGDVDILLLDKTGTITLGNRMASEFIPMPGVQEKTLAEASFYSSLSDETPEGKSIAELAIQKFGFDPVKAAQEKMTVIPFTAQTRISGVERKGQSIRKGAIDTMLQYISDEEHQRLKNELQKAVARVAKEGGTPLAVAQDGRMLGVIYLKDIIKPGIRQRFLELRRMGIRTVMITGDNPLTAAAIAAEAGVDDFIAEATPEMKLIFIRKEQNEGKLVAMCGDGSNDAPALAQADVGIAMNTGTQAAREAGNMVDLDSDPTKLIEVVMIGKQLLMTRGSLTTFSIANDVAKYFAIIPALFVSIYPPLATLNIMKLHSDGSAIVSSIIFNALIVIILIPLALKGVTYKPVGAKKLLSRNLLIYGFGGLIAPFIGIKLIDMVLTALGWV